MEKYSDIYEKRLESVEALKAQLMDSIVIAIKTISVKPLHIGNLVYFYVTRNGVDVPAYCYDRDYSNLRGNNKNWDDAQEIEELAYKCNKLNLNLFYPIYDADCTHHFGWADFSRCCEIFDVIRYTLFHTK